MDKVAEFVVNLVKSGRVPGIVFARTKARAKALASEIGAGLGRRIAVVTSEMGKSERAVLADIMRSDPSREPAVVATAAWSTGVDIPGLQWVAFADRGQAPIGTTQAAGRAARVAKGKGGYEVFEFCEESAPARSGHLSGYCADAAFVQSFSLPTHQRLERPPSQRAERQRQREQQALVELYYQQLGRKLMWGFFIGGGVLMSLMFG